MKPEEKFLNDGHIKYDLARLAHLDELNIDFEEKYVLEVGAGIGIHTEHLLTLGAEHVTASDGRPENVRIMEKKFDGNPDVPVREISMDPPKCHLPCFQIIYCYGLLYNIGHPIEAIEWMSQHCHETLLVETAVLYGREKENDIMYFDMDKTVPSHSVTGNSCRFGRKWIQAELEKHFRHVYCTVNQPDNVYFPLDWTRPTWEPKLSRCVFVASRERIKNPLLVKKMPYLQRPTRNKKACFEDMEADHIKG